MKAIIYAILMFGFSYIGLSQTSFEFCIDTDEDCIVWEAVNDPSGNSIIVGGIGTFTGLHYDAYVLKLFPDGKYIEKRFDKVDTVGFFSTIEVLDNGNYFITGSFSATNDYHEKTDFWVVILDPDLNLITEKSYKIREGYIDILGVSQSIIDYEGNIIVVTTPKEDGGIQYDFSALGFYKLSPSGDTIVSRYYNYLFDDLPYELKQLPYSNDLLLIAKTMGGSLIFFDTDLNIIKENSFIDSHIGGTDPCSDFWLNDTSFLISGKGDGINGDSYLRIETMDTSGRAIDTLNINRIDTLDYPAWKKSMAYANDTTIYIGGFTAIVDFWTTDPTTVELYVIDRYLNVLGHIDFGGDAYYELWGIIATDDNGCLLYGIRYTNPDVPERDVYIWKVLREDIELLVSVKETNSLSESINVYPNPVQNKISIDLGKNRDWEDLQLSITSMEGKTVFQKRIKEKGNLLEADLSNLKAGLYILRIADAERNIYSEKIIKN